MHHQITKLSGHQIAFMKLYLLVIAATFIFAHPVSAQSVRKVKVTELEQLIRESKTPLMINFWATFCKPCIEEMPYLQKAATDHAADSLQLILVSLDLQEDYPKKVEAFVQKRKMAGKLFWLDEFDADYFCPKVDPAWSGAIPATLFINNKNGYRRFVEEQLSPEKLTKEVNGLLGK